MLEEQEAAPLSESERDWQDRLAQENWQQQKKDRKARARARMDRPFRRGERPEKSRQRAAARAYWAGRGRMAAEIVPFAGLLLLAPFIDSPGWFYLLVLVTAAPLALAAIALRPLGHGGWLFRMLAPLLPAEIWLALRYGLWNPAGTLLPVSLCALAGAVWFIFALRGRGERRGEDGDGQGFRPELEVKDRRQARRARSRDEKAASMAYGRRLLLFVTALAAISLAVPAALGVGLALRRPQRMETDPARQQDDAYIAQRMTEAYENMLPEVWGAFTRAQKEEALRTLLNAEIDFLEMPYYYELRDPAALSISRGRGEASVAAALHSGKSRTEFRVRAICHLAFHLRQLTISGQKGGDLRIMRPYEEDARGYEDARWARYAAIGEGIALEP